MRAPRGVAGGHGQRRSGKLSSRERVAQKEQLAAALEYMKSKGLGSDQLWTVAHLQDGSQRRWPLINYMTFKRHWENAVSETPAVDSRAILTPQEEEDLVKIILLADDSPDDEAKTRPEIRDLIVDMLKVRHKQTRRGRETYRKNAVPLSKAAQDVLASGGKLPSHRWFRHF